MKRKKAASKSRRAARRPVATRVRREKQPLTVETLINEAELAASHCAVDDQWSQE